MTIEDYVVTNNRAGNLWVGSKIITGVANGASIYTLVRTYSKPIKIVNVAYETVGEWVLNSLSGSTITSDGNEVNYANRNIGTKSTKTAKVFYNPTVTVDGTIRIEARFGNGTTPSKNAPVSIGQGNITIVPANSYLVLKLTNNSGSTQYISGLIEWIEE